MQMFVKFFNNPRGWGGPKKLRQARAQSAESPHTSMRARLRRRRSDRVFERLPPEIINQVAGYLSTGREYKQLAWSSRTMWMTLSSPSSIVNWYVGRFGGDPRAAWDNLVMSVSIPMGLLGRKASIEYLFRLMMRRGLHIFENDCWDAIRLFRVDAFELTGRTERRCLPDGRPLSTANICKKASTFDATLYDPPLDIYMAPHLLKVASPEKKKACLEMIELARTYYGPTPNGFLPFKDNEQPTG